MASTRLLRPSWILLLATSMLALGFGCASEEDRTAPVSAKALNWDRVRRNVVLITVDTTRADYLQPYGSELVKTPVLQKLADEGILMEEAYAVAPLTLPAHTAIHTGLYPIQTGVRNNGTHFVAPELSTLAERFTAEGYRSGAFVSAAVLERRYGLDQGFEIYDDDLSKSRMRLPRMVADRPAQYTVESAAKWLDSLADDETFFLWVHFYDPHAVYNPPPKFRDAYKTHPYAGEIAYMDEQIGQLLAHERIADSPELVVSVIGDHGESLGEHGENTHGILAYRATLHVPWILWVKGANEARRIAPAVSQVDLAPTLLDLAGILTPRDSASMAGQSLLGDVSSERLLYSESYLPYFTYGWSPLQVVRKGRWELIDAPTAELYDLARDPMELSDQSVRLPEIAADLESELKAFRGENEAAGEAEQKLEIDHEALERLRALGYVSMNSEPPSMDGPRANPKEMIHLHTKLERARSFINEGLYAEAAALLEGLLEQDPNNLAAMADLASARQRDGRLDEASVVIGSALALDPNHQQLTGMLAQIEGERGNLVRAIELAERVIELNRTNLGAWALKARCQSRLDDAEAAKQTLILGLEIDANSPLLNTLYAQLVELPANMLVEAEQRLRLAITRDPFNTSPRRILGRLLEREGRLEEAEETYRQGLSYTPDDSSLHGLYAVLLARRGHPDAEAHLKEAIRKDSEFRSELYVSLGAQLNEKGHHEEARAAFDKVLARNPSDPAARNNRAIALAQSGQVDEARKALEILVGENPRYADAHNNLAVILLSSGDVARAEEHARATVRLAPAVAEAWDTLGASLLAQDRAEEALVALDKSLNIQANYWSALLHRGLAKSALEDGVGAKLDLEAALAANNSIPDVYFELGRLLDTKLNQPANAKDYYRAFVDKFPDDHRIDEVHERLLAMAPDP